ncbi:MAG: hypothetical protein LBJ86_04495 [Spirochaetaceae bacterium]|nr:hypothetical protein [Spirochaetaceae bacterium]
MKRKIYVLQLLFLTAFVSAQGRTLESLFPGTDAAVLQAARQGGYSHSIRTADGAAFNVNPTGEIGAAFTVKQTSPLYIIENLLVLKNDNPVTKLDIYNALRRISTLKGRQYFSSTRNRATVLFEDASVIAGEKNLKKQNDPPSAASMPRSETIFVTVDDANFGNCYYRAKINTDGAGIGYSLSNFRNISYLLIPVIKPDGLLIELYIEPLAEGVLIYGLTGVNVASFADRSADIPSSITKRLDVINEWIGDNINKR